jgi:hypothetical protein
MLAALDTTPTRGSLFASQSKAERTTHVVHPVVAKLTDSPTDDGFLDSHEVMEVDRARLLEPIVGTNDNL